MLERNDMILRDDRMSGQNAQLSPYLAQQMPRGPYGPQGIPPEQAEPSLLASIFRHAWIVILVLALSLGAACVYLNRTQPLYASIAKIYIQPVRGPSSPELAAVESANYLTTQCQLIKSSSMLLRLLDDPDVKALPGFSQIPAQLGYLHKHVDADVDRKSDIISVSVETPNANESAVLVNALVNAYRSDREAKAATIGNTYLATLEANKQEIERKLTETRQKIEEIKKLDPNLRLDPTGTSNPLIVQMMAAAQALANVRIQMKQMEATYGPAARQMQQLQQQAAALDEDYRTAKNEALKTSDKQLQIQALKLDEQELLAQREPLVRRINELQIDVDRQRQITPIEVVEHGEAIDKPSFPKKTNTLALAGVLGVLLGSGLALLRDKMDTRLRTIEEVQNILGLSILGVVPRMPGRRTAVARAMAVHLDPRSEVAEAYRTIRTAVYFSGQGVGNRAKTLLVTSPEPGDGKTTSASNLAIAIAQTGRNILLLDADFRKPTQHKNLDVKDTVGLSSVLAGIETLDRAIQRTGVEGLDILPCGPIPENPSEILNSQEFGELIDRLALKYDHILFDSPPANLVTDARILGAVCDATILVLRAEKSTRKAAEHARNALLNVGANLLGLIVNDVPRGKGYEVYGGSYYGTPEMRSPRRQAAAEHPNGNGTENPNLARLPKPTSEVSD
jgi:capsular exopolysaccharide synthesis family protein